MLGKADHGEGDICSRWLRLRTQVNPYTRDEKEKGEARRAVRRKVICNVGGRAHKNRFRPPTLSRLSPSAGTPTFLPPRWSEIRGHCPMCVLQGDRCHRVVPGCAVSRTMQRSRGGRQEHHRGFGAEGGERARGGVRVCVDGRAGIAAATSLQAKQSTASQSSPAISKPARSTRRLKPTTHHLFSQVHQA